VYLSVELGISHVAEVLGSALALRLLLASTEALDSGDGIFLLPQSSIRIDTNHTYNDDHNQHPVFGEY
jgi:hypothetical protein